MKIGNVIDTLISVKDRNRSALTSDQIIAINFACNILENYFDSQEDAFDVEQRGKE